jgi:hypothetical protein
MGKYSNEIMFSDNGAGVTINEHMVMTLDENGNEDKTGDRKNNIGSKSITVEYSIDGGADFESVNSLVISFDSGSGALKKPSVDSRMIFRIYKTGTEYYKYVVISSLTGNVSILDEL